MRRHRMLLVGFVLALLAGCGDALNSEFEFFNRARFISTKQQEQEFHATYAINRPFADVAAKAKRELKEKGWTQVEDSPSHVAFTGIKDYDRWRVVRFDLRPSQNSAVGDVAKKYPDGTEVTVLKYTKKD